MRHAAKHARIPNSPFAERLRNARLDNLCEEVQGNARSLILDYQELVLDTAPELVEHEGALAEYLHGYYVPRRLRFSGIITLRRTGLYAALDGVPTDHPARSLQGILLWYPPEKTEPMYLLLNGSTEPAALMLSARRCLEETRSGPHTSVSLTRHWSSPPALRSGVVPHPKQLLRRYGGDPITIRLGKRQYHRRLFVGGLEHQSETRPKVDVVLNLAEEPSR